MDWVHRRLHPIGKRLGESVFDLALAYYEKNSPTLQQQKAPYSNTIGDAFTVYVITLAFPAFYQLNNLFLEWTVPNDLPDTLFWDLQTTNPSLQYGIYGGSVVIVGSIYLSDKLFDNFLVGDVEKGQTLALAHAALVFVGTGFSFQVGAQYENELSPPGDGPYALPDYYYFFFENLGIVIPYLTVIFLVGFGVIVYLSVDWERETIQTTITSERWERSAADQSRASNESE